MISQNNNFTFTKMKQEHLSQVFEIETSCFSLPWSLENLNKELSNEKAYYIVVLDGDKVIGFAGYWQILDETEIMRVVVSPKYRRMGIALTLLTKLSENSIKNGVANSFLEVRESNSAAIALYTKFGYEHVSIRKKYYENNGENAVVMIKKY